jgi:hypothetical protein
MVGKEIQVCETACRLWELAGRPKGRYLEFWLKAEVSLETTRIKPGGNGDSTIPRRADRIPVSPEVAASAVTPAEDSLPE